MGRSAGRRAGGYDLPRHRHRRDRAGHALRHLGRRAPPPRRRRGGPRFYQRILEQPQRRCRAGGERRRWCVRTARRLGDVQRDGGGCQSAAAAAVDVGDPLVGASEALALNPGERYYSTVAATAAAASWRARARTGIVCDESPPVVLGAPTLHAADGAAALALPSTVEVPAGVFRRGERPRVV